MHAAKSWERQPPHGITPSSIRAARSSGSLPQNLRPVRLVLRKHPRFLERGLTPFAPGWKRHHGRHVGARGEADLDRIGVETRYDRRIHRVGGGKMAE